MWHQLNFQDAVSAIMENIIFFHDYAIIFLIIIIILILYIIFFVVSNKLINRNLLEGQFIEIIWTIIPIFLLFFLAIPSLKILYLTDENNNAIFTFKVIGHQWYWEYEYNLFFLDKDFVYNCSTDSIIELNNYLDNFRLLDVTKHFFIPIICQIRLLITSEDVIHSFTVPSLGVKVDAVPGRLNQINILICRPGLFYGQCSEICGVNHRFMPIVIESINLLKFIKEVQKE